MATLEELKRGAAVRGMLPDGLVTVVDVAWYGSNVVELTYKDAGGHLGSELLYRDREPTLEIATAGRPWSFDGDGAMLRLVSEAQRIRLAYLFDPVLAVHTSIVDPLPHQITAVYEEMLTRQPLRFLLADDPGAGKTIMAGLLIKELLIRGDLQRCLICCPGSLAEQWQDELWRRFGLNFDVITRESIESSRSGNPYAERNLVISRLDHMSRNEDIQAKLEQVDWDLVICDEAHKMSASFFGGEVKETKRYKLAKLLGAHCRNFLLMTATPHNGKEEDFQLFMALLDADRFEGKFRDGVHQADTSDMMRRLVKEKLVKFDNTPLFPERIASTVTYTLSDAEAALYKDVTEYVREEMNRADRLAQEGEGRRGNTVGFALTILQRRLASSPEAIYQSLRRRRERLEKRLREEQLQKRGGEIPVASTEGRLRSLRDADVPLLSDEDLDDLDDAPDAEVERIEEQIADQATAARTIAELGVEIGSLERLEELALRVRQAGTDRKWDELSRLLQDNDEMFDAEGSRRKLIIFTEHRDTLNYLHDRITSLLGRSEAVVMIHGGMGREERRKVQEAFTQDKDVQILLATDAAGEGLNLQRAHLMVNYDLPWNPNRLEQRFGRIHRIGQTEVCHLWNLVALETREGDVFHQLFTKLDEERKALGGQVFDVLGKIFGETPLRQLLIDAIRYGDQPEVRAQLTRKVDQAMDRAQLAALIEERALAQDSMDTARVLHIREEMDRAEARRLQPHFIASFFLEAFKLLGGSISKREPDRYEVTHVPAAIRGRDRQIGSGEVIRPSYERITFDKGLIAVPGKPLAAFVCPGHPLLDATIDLILERYRDLLKRGAVLVDRTDPGEDVRALFYLEHALQDARTDREGNRRVVSKRLQFVEIDGQGLVRDAGPAPYLDYRPISDEERAAVADALDAPWLRGNMEGTVLGYAAQHLVPGHLEEVRRRKEKLVSKTVAAVNDRLTKEINYWDHRAEQLKQQELAGKTPRLNSGLARKRADELEARLQKRRQELEQERQVSPLPPVVIGGALVVPMGLLARLGVADGPALHTLETARVERLAMDAVMEAEQRLGFEPRDVGAQKLGYDVESTVPGGSLRFIEVKGRVVGSDTVTVTKNEILTALNKPDDFILAIVEVDGTAGEPRYVREPFRREPDFGATGVIYKLGELLARAGDPT
jgi:SNF2 family DNA or RNA helicase